jgi:hypothetical protein
MIDDQYIIVKKFLGQHIIVKKCFIRWMKRCTEHMLSDFFDMLLVMNNLLHRMDENWFTKDMLLVMYI